METNYLIIPGYGNSGSTHWQTYFENNLPNCSRIQQKSWEKPICEDWVENINKVVAQFDPETVVLISHSMGGIALVHWAKRFKTKIKGAMIVAPADVENPFADYPIDSFLPIPMLKLPFPSLLVASTNDNWATNERTQLFAENWGSKLLFIGDAGHMNATSGYGDWSEGITILKNEF